MILAGTDLLIDFLVSFQPVKNQIAGYIKAEQLQTTVVTCSDLLSGADESKRGHAVRQLLHALKVLAARPRLKFGVSSTGPARQLPFDIQLQRINQVFAGSQLLLGGLLFRVQDVPTDVTLDDLCHQGVERAPANRDRMQCLCALSLIVDRPNNRANLSA